MASATSSSKKRARVGLVEEEPAPVAKVARPDVVVRAAVPDRKHGGGGGGGGADSSRSGSEGSSDEDGGSAGAGGGGGGSAEEEEEEDEEEEGDDDDDEEEEGDEDEESESESSEEVEEERKAPRLPRTPRERAAGRRVIVVLEQACLESVKTKKVCACTHVRAVHLGPRGHDGSRALRPRAGVRAAELRRPPGAPQEVQAQFGGLETRYYAPGAHWRRMARRGGGGAALCLLAGLA